jgi:hypothetical protein
MGAWLGKQWWQGIGVLVAVLLFFGSLWWTRSIKAVSYEVVSQTPLVSLQDSAARQLQVLYNGQPVADVSLIVLRVQNTGNEPIPTVDYEKPITFQFGEGAQVLSAEITEMTPPNLGASVRLTPNSVELAPTLLNSEDTLLVKALISGSAIKVTADARIVGVRELLVRQVDPNPLTTYIIMVGIAIWALFQSIPNIRWVYDKLKDWQQCTLIQRGGLVFWFVVWGLGLFFGGYTLVFAISKIVPRFL